MPAELTFHLDGYEDGVTQIVPTTDDSVRVKLTPRPHVRRGRDEKKPQPATTEQSKEQPPSTGETLPNPY